MRLKRTRGAVVVLAAALIVAGCGGSDSSPTVEEGTPLTVVYSVTGTMDSTDVTYTKDGANEVVRATETLPFELTLDLAVGDLVDLGAISSDGNSVTCRILVNDELFRETTGEDGNAAVCQGVLVLPDQPVE